jgi:hypothetical protein
MDLQEMSGVNYKLLTEALEESAELLQEDNNRLRNTNRILRKINSILRKKIVDIEAHSDQLMVMLDNQTEVSLSLNEEAGVLQTQADALMVALDDSVPNEAIIQPEYL